jgi:hypothetical protein
MSVEQLSGYLQVTLIMSLWFTRPWFCRSLKVHMFGTLMSTVQAWSKLLLNSLSISFKLLYKRSNLLSIVTAKLLGIAPSSSTGFRTNEAYRLMSVCPGLQRHGLPVEARTKHHQIPFPPVNRKSHHDNRQECLSTGPGGS